MRGKTIWGACLLAAGLALAPGLARAQDNRTIAHTVGEIQDTGFGAAGFAPEDPILWNPLYSTRPEDGGFYAWGQYVMYRQTNPLVDQQVAVRGFIAVDDSVLGPGTAGTFIGTRNEALNVSQLAGPNSYQPGFEAGLGWRFRDGTTISFNFLFISDAQYRAAATSANRNLALRSDLADSFLTAYVFNFPNAYAGAPFKIGGPGSGFTPQAAFGIWDAASIMTEEFIQRAQQYEITWRFPVYETECYRLSGLMGPRMFWLWERYRWSTTSQDITGNTPDGNLDEAIYTNIVSNRMWGGKIGVSQEWYIGHGFACMCDLQAALFVDSVKETAQYQLGDKFASPQAKRSRRDWATVPELQGTLGIMWYITGGIQLQLGYDTMAFFNTISSPRPVDFNYGALAPKYESQFRFFDGWKVGAAFIF
jgi:hypothetical protein